MSLTVGIISSGGQLLPVLQQGTCEIETVGVASVQSTAVAADTEAVRLVSTTDCWISIGTNPTAAASGTASLFLPANVVEWWAVPKGASYIVAHIQDAAGGTLSITQANTNA